MTSFLCGIANDARFIPCLIGVTTHTVILNIPYSMASNLSRPEPNRPLDITPRPGWKVIMWTQVDELAEGSWERWRTPIRVLTCSLPLCSHPQLPSDTLWPSSVWLANVQSPPMLTSSLGWALLSNTWVSGLQPAAIQPASSLQSRAPQPASTLLFAHALNHRGACLL